MRQMFKSTFYGKFSCSVFGIVIKFCLQKKVIYIFLITLFILIFKPNLEIDTQKYFVKNCKKITLYYLTFSFGEQVQKHMVIVIRSIW